jgi:dipeptidyl-peptidase-4
VWVEWDREKYEYLANVRWDPTGPLTVLLQDRAQREQLLRRVDLASGFTDTLAHESVPGPPAWINLPPGDLPKWRADGKMFLWMTTGVDGPAVLHCDAGGAQTAWFAFTSALGFREIAGYDPTTGRVAAVVTRGTRVSERFDSPAEEQAFRPDPDPTRSALVLYDPGLSPDRSTWRRFTDPDDVVMSATFNDKLTQFVLTHTGPGRMPQSTLYAAGDLSARRIGELPSVALEPPFKPNVKFEKVGDYWTAVVRPRDFDPRKKYPVIVDVYGGPRHLHVVRAMRNWLVPQWLADQGFVVVAIDNRGTPGRGRDWERAVYQKFGTLPLQDQIQGLKALLAKSPELDGDRVGIVGWSFGGYMAANGVLRRPDVFQAAVAGAPVTDWEDYDTHYTERYMGLLPESRKAYDEASLIPLAKDLKRPLLLVHGTADDNVYYRHTLKLADALFRAGKEFDSLALPGVTHMYSADPVVMERLWARTAGYFKRHLGEPK